MCTIARVKRRLIIDAYIYKLRIPARESPRVYNKVVGANDLAIVVKAAWSGCFVRLSRKRSVVKVYKGVCFQV